MKITNFGQAGTVESGDIRIQIEANQGQGVVVELNGKSVVMKQFATQMKSVILEKIKFFNLDDVTLKAQDNGALDYVIRARVETAIKRAFEGG